ncbi:alpha/beta hydrolase [Natronorarus salvus]|uniref:alpha/beta hydrolase n=1 Tax=Natronorarus salvus TaxID=3117733 RepID=UPI002F26C40B
MGRRLRLPGERDVRATLDGSEESDRIVVACPPHPQHGGGRSDPRLRAVSDALGERGIASLRIDYGDWDRGRGEREDAECALGWAADRFVSTGIFGYSFGASVALCAAAEVERALSGVSALAPAPEIETLDALSAIGRIDAPVQVLYGPRDRTVDSRPIAEAVRQRGGVVEALDADHFFVGKNEGIGDRVACFFAP